MYDLGAGRNVLRWTVSSIHGEPPAGGFLLDEFTVSPPRPLAIEYQPMDATVYSGSRYFLNVVAEGTPPLHYQWYENGKRIPGATNNPLDLVPTGTDDSGTYSVKVTSSQGSVLSSNAIVTVLPPSPPIFEEEPASTVAYTRQNFSWWIAVEGSQPLEYQWSKNGIKLPDGTSFTLTLTNISSADAGNYAVYVRNKYGGVKSTNAVLTVLPSVAPVITNQPRSLDVAIGVNTWFGVGASGAPSPTYTWTEVGQPPPQPAPPGQPIQFPGLPLPGYPPSTETFDNVGATNAGIYFATASNVAGTAVSRKGVLTVLPPITNVATWNQDAVDILVTNGLAFLARGTNGLAILNVTNPAAPQLLGTLATTGNIVKLAEAGGLIYAAASDAGLQIISVSNACQPVLVGTYAADAAEDVTVRSNLAYVADPTQPIPVGHYTDASQPTALAVDNGWVYIAGPGSPMEILKTPFDTSPPTPPQLSVSATGGMNLRLRGRHGRYYLVETSDRLNGGQWQPLQTLMLTNDTAVIPVPADGGSQFFRLAPQD